MKALLTLAAMFGLLLAPSVTLAKERTGDAVMGAAAGAVVGGPVGAVVGGAVGYTAGPAIARELGLKGRPHHHHPVRTR